MVRDSELRSQTADGSRKPAVAGQFYPASETTLFQQLSQFFGAVTNLPSHDQLRAILVPHAGYDFSGQIAAEAYAQLSTLNVYDNIFILASSHRVSLGMASVYTAGDYLTPLGRVRVNTEIGMQLCEHPLVTYDPAAHRDEHSIEVQLPFLQFIGQVPPIIPIVIASQSPEVAEALAEALRPWFHAKNLFIISADFSHYPAYSDAQRVDSLTADAFCSGDPKVFLRVLTDNERSGVRGLATSMCAWPAALTLLHLGSRLPDLYWNHLAYGNSGDIQPYGDKRRVVGYHALALYDRRPAAGFALTQRDRYELLKLARHALSHHVYHIDEEKPYEGSFSTACREKAGAFVTLKMQGELRGCLGNFAPDLPLIKLIPDLTRSSASHDRRFFPVRADEVNRIEIEISVLSPMIQISQPEQIRLGTHGIYIKKGSKSGTLLPQVALETGWTLEEFLGHCARDKAGLEWDGWKSAEVYIYEADVFRERK